MKIKFYLALFCLLFLQASNSIAADFTGQFDKKLVPNVEEHEKVIFRNVAPSLRTSGDIPDSAYVTVSRILNPSSGSAHKAMLVEEKGQLPAIYVDLNDDNSISDDEKFTLKKELENNPYLWNTTVNLPMKNSFFTDCPVFLRYFRNYTYGKMTDSDRLITQSTEAFVRGSINADGKNIPVQFEYSFKNKKIDAENGWIGVDMDGDGEIDMNNLSPEAANANDEKVVFRVGNLYISPKKADIDKNLIVFQENKAKDYKRVELVIGKEMPDFEFNDMNGKKRRFSEFRGKYVILDVWGFWCPPCRVEMPYLREAYKRYKNRGLEIVGLNTDPVPFEAVKKNLEVNDMNWTQAQFKSVYELLQQGFRVESFPTTFLISPEGKILSMSRSDRDELDLRGKDLLTTLDEILPK